MMNHFQQYDLVPPIIPRGFMCDRSMIFIGNGCLKHLCNDGSRQQPFDLALHVPTDSLARGTFRFIYTRERLSTSLGTFDTINRGWFLC